LIEGVVEARTHTRPDQKRDTKDRRLKSGETCSSTQDHLLKAT